MSGKKYPVSLRFEHDGESFVLQYGKRDFKIMAREGRRNLRFARGTVAEGRFHALPEDMGESADEAIYRADVIATARRVWRRFIVSTARVGKGRNERE